MSFINQIIGYPLGWVMWAFYEVTQNYGVALILFTIFTRVILVPLAIRQQKSTAKMAFFRPKMEEIQKKYKNDKQKLQEEMTKLYEKEGYNPMSGCLPTLIQLPILFGLIDVIYKPLTHILRIPKESIAAATEIAKAAGKIGYSAEIAIFNGVKNDPSAYSVLGQDIITRIASLKLTFLGIDLSMTPSLAFNILLLIPILSGVTSLLVSLMTMKNTAATSGEAGAGPMKGMMYIMPIFSAYFTFMVPVGVGLYWVISNLLMMLQVYLLNKAYNPAEMAKALQDAAEARHEDERQRKIEARKKLVEYQGEDNGDKKETSSKKERSDRPEKPIDIEALSQKELNRIKLAAARKRDAEKYGEEYVEVSDKDLV